MISLRRALPLLALLFCAGAAHAQCGALFLNGKLFISSGGFLCTPPPAALPLVTQAQIPTTFTYLGSFRMPTSFAQRGAALSVNQDTVTVAGTACASGCAPGTLLYAGAFSFDANDTNNNVDGLGAVQIPALNTTGGLSYTGLNGTATQVAAPARGGSYVTNATYTLTTAPTTGVTTATFSGSAPAGMAANAGWYVGFEKAGATCPSASQGTNQTFELVTGWNSGTSTITFASLPAGTYTTGVCVHQWNPAYPFGYASGDRITGSYEYSGNLYITGGAYYDASCNKTNGWIVTTSASTPGSGWGSVNTAAGSVPEYSRRYSGPIAKVPTAFQAALGGPLYVSSGAGLSNIGCAPNGGVPIGFQLATFNPSNVTASGNNGGVGVPLGTALDYFYQGELSTAWPESLNSRSFTGPFPLCVSAGTCPPYTTYYPATLTSAPTTGATTATLTTISGTVTATYNLTNQSSAICLTAITSGTLSNSSIAYYAVGPGIPGTTYIVPAWDQGPGNPTSSGTCSGTSGVYTLSNPATASETGQTVTLTPLGYINSYGATQGAYWTVTFSDGETRIVHTMPYGYSCAATIPCALSGSQDPTSFAPLTCSPSCTTAITIAPMGDNYVSPYDGAIGQGFFIPNTRTYANIIVNQFGPHTSRPAANTASCISGSSGSNETPIPPDTAGYSEIKVLLYDEAVLADQAGGVAGADTGASVSSSVLTTTDADGSGTFAPGQVLSGGTLPSGTYISSAAGTGSGTHLWNLANNYGVAIPNNSGPFTVSATSPVYGASPYASAAFPGQSNLIDPSNNCLTSTVASWAAYDPTNGILYATFTDSIGTYTYGNGHQVIYEWHVNHP